MVSDNKELLAILYQLSNILTKKRKWWISDNYIRLLQYLNALSTSEIAIAFKFPNTYFVIVECHIAVLVTLVNLVDGAFTLSLRKQIDILALVACGNKSLQTKFLIILHKVIEELALPRIITIAKHHFVLEVWLVMPQFVFNIHTLCVELVLLRPLRRRKRCIVAHYHAPTTPRLADACAPFGFGFAESSLRSKLLRRISPLRENSMRKTLPRINRRGDRLACTKKSAFPFMHSTVALPQADTNTRRENAPSWTHPRLHAVRVLK